MSFRTLAVNWSKNHRHHGGLSAALRCLIGHWRLAAGWVRPAQAARGSDCVTFSVLPWMTVLWGRLLRDVADGAPLRLWIGDCSGGLRSEHRRALGIERARVVPLLNLQHGEKLDLFFRRLCRSELVLVCDDDVFWLSDEPWRWATACLAEDPDVVVASLAPRVATSNVMSDEVPVPMGSSCLVVRRRLWVELGLSFRVQPAPLGKDQDWFYDTADHANVEIVRRGYKVAIAPERILHQLATPEAMSTWVLKMQKHPAKKLAAVADIPLRREKAWRALRVAEEAAALLRRLPEIPSQAQLLPAERIRSAAASIETLLPPEPRAAIEDEVAELMGALEGRLGLSGVAGQARAVEP